MTVRRIVAYAWRTRFWTSDRRTTPRQEVIVRAQEMPAPKPSFGVDVGTIVNVLAHDR